MSDRRRRLRVKSDEDSEDPSSESEPESKDLPAKNSSKGPQKKECEKGESEYESAEGEGEGGEAVQKNGRQVRCNEEEIGSPTELIDEEGGEEGIAETEDVGEDFLGGDIIDGTDEEGEEEGCVEEERQQGDGEECSPVAEKPLDFDEDRRNPQYIPKKGTFYEHDDRNVVESPKETEIDTTTPTATREKKKKKLWFDEGKWGHDRYREDEQTPKSRTELIDAYGYDIRCEDCPPRARRRRRYGRGPSKYERSWEDETAYGKEHVYGLFRGRGTTGERRGRGRFRGRTTYSNTGRRFVQSSPDVHEGAGDDSVPAAPPRPVENSKDSDITWDREETPAEETKPVLNNKDFPELTQSVKDTRPQSPESSSKISQRKSAAGSEVPFENGSSVRTQTFENSSYVNEPPVYDSLSNMDDRPPRRGKIPPFRGSYRGAHKRPPRVGRGRQSGGTGRYNNPRNSYPRPNLAPRLMDKQIRAINSEIDRLTLNEKGDADEEVVAMVREQINNKPMLKKMNGAKQVLGMAPKNEDTSSRPKRYSSLRQRSLPETTSYQSAQPPVPLQHPPFYDAGYQAAMYATEAVAASSQPQSTGSPPIINPPQYQTYNPAAYQDNYALRLPVNNAPRLFPQVTLPAGQPIIAPTPPCMTPTPGLINYPPPPPPQTAYPQFTYQQYPAPPPPLPPVSQPPPDMFRGGITYYYPQTQPPTVRHVPQKRPKAAIPIMPPPENEVKIREKKELTEVEGRNEESVNSASSLVETDSQTIQIETSNVPIQAPVEVES